MSSDTIKDALVAAYPNTSAKDWKRRSKTKVGLAQHRTFEHPQHGEVLTVEDSDGNVSIHPTLGEKITEAGKANVRELAAAVEAATGPLFSVLDSIADPSPEADFEFEPPKLDLNILTDVFNADEIGAGDRIRVPAGTTYWGYSDYAGGSLGRPYQSKDGDERIVVGVVGVANFLAFTSTAILREIAQVQCDIDAKLWPDNPRMQRSPAKMTRDELLSETSFTLNWISEASKNGGRAVAYRDSAELREIVERARLDAIAREGENPRFVMWGTTHDRFVARLESVEKIADKSQVVIPPAPKKKEKAITKRTLMVEKSKWRFTQDTRVSLWVYNPEINVLIGKRDVYRRGDPRADVIQKQIDVLDRYVKIDAIEMKAGAIIEVMGKIYSDGQFSWVSNKKETNGLMVPSNLVSGDYEALHPGVAAELSKTRRSFGSMAGYRGCWFAFPYKQIEASVEAESIPETIVWAIRDTRTGDFFGGWQTEEHAGYNRQTNEPKMSSTFSGAKKYANSSAAKASVRDFTGYNAGLDDEGSSEEWLGIGYDTKKIDLPETWELVGIDKTTGQEKQVEDLQAWYKGLMRLRVLTAGHGSAVRAVYKKAEGKESLEAILLFTNVEDDGNKMPWEQEQDGGKAKIAMIDKAVKSFSIKPIRAKSGASLAFACALDDAYLGKLSCGVPDVETKIYDLSTLEEIVEQQKASV